MWYNNILEITNKTVKAIWNCKLNYLLIPLPTVCCDLITSCQLQDDATFGNDATFGMTSVFTLKFNVRFKMITIQSVLGNLKWGECLLKVCQRYYMKWEECLLVSLTSFTSFSYYPMSENRRLPSPLLAQGPGDFESSNLWIVTYF